MGTYQGPGHQSTNCRGFNPILVRADDPRTRPPARAICCENCERPLARVQNFVREGLANVEIECVCGMVTALTLVATRRA